MKRTTIIILLLTLFVSCKEEKLDVYKGDNYVYFTYMSDRAPQEVIFNFATDAPLVNQAKAKLSLTLLGYLFEEDTKCSFSYDKDKTSGRPGIDFQPLEQFFFASNKVVDTCELIINRNEELLNTDYVVNIILDQVDAANVGPKEFNNVTVRVVDKLAKPKWWDQSLANNLGEYSDIKYRLFIIFMDGVVLESLDDYTGVEFMELIAEYKLWWKAEWVKGNYKYYDEDGVTPLYETILD